MIKITFKGKDYDVTLEGDTIAAIKSDYARVKEDLAQELGAGDFGAADINVQKSKVRAVKDTAAARMLSLLAEGFFDQPRKMGEIKTKLEEKGFFYPLTSLPPYLLKLCRERNLKRFKSGKLWVYVRP